jgi:hypothetical protein
MHTFPFIAFMKSNKEEERGRVILCCITGGNEEGIVTAGGHWSGEH